MAGDLTATEGQASCHGSARDRPVLLLQLLATAATIAWVPGNVTKLAALLVIWLLGFGRISTVELAVAGAVNALFVLMDVGAIGQGLFRFHHPDFWGLPAYEFLMWGFYILHTIRFVAARTAPVFSCLALGLAAVFALPFSLMSDPWMLLLASASVLVITILIFRDPVDLAYTGYMVVVGALIEYDGVWHDQWSYGGHPPGGVPLWFITMWGGIGLFTRRLIVPILNRASTRISAMG
jgi:hypothetical protein